MRATAGLKQDMQDAEPCDLLAEVAVLCYAADILRLAFEAIRTKRVLFCGHCYYIAWYLSCVLRSLGW